MSNTDEELLKVTMKTKLDNERTTERVKKLLKDTINTYVINNIYSDMKLSENFYLSEFTKSQTAARWGINNAPNKEELENIKTLVKELLQPLRDHLGRVITVSSGYRNKRLNEVLRGSKTSQHMKGEAVDIEVLGMDNKELFNLIKDCFSFDQLILEYYEEGVKNSGWIHVSYKSLEENRGEVLIAKKVKRGGRTRTVYEKID